MGSRMIHRCISGMTKWRLTAAVLAGASVVGLSVSCQPEQSRRPWQRASQPQQQMQVTMPLASSYYAEPVVRVRIAKRALRVTLGGAGSLTIGAEPNDPKVAVARPFASPLTITRQAGRFVITDARRGAVAWQLPAMRIVSPSASPMTIDGKPYPGVVVLVPTTDKTGQPTDAFDIVSHVPLETYLPGVIERELYPKWLPETFAAQAIAARSYALFEQTLRANSHYDLESTTASQVYGGAATNPRAIDAVRRTRGLVVTHRGRIVPTFFSSACGGTGQDATAAFPHLATTVDIPPLRGQHRSNFCTGSNYFTWGPIERDTATLARRIAAWGSVEKNRVASMIGLRHVHVSSRSSAGRPATFELTDRQGKRYTLPAEQFRFACNYNATGLPAVSAATQLRSSHVDVLVVGEKIRFTAGHGFGHGVGMCQWGAQGMATKGYPAAQIIAYYYPGASLERLW